MTSNFSSRVTACPFPTALVRVAGFLAALCAGAATFAAEAAKSSTDASHEVLTHRLGFHFVAQASTPAASPTGGALSSVFTAPSDERMLALPKVVVRERPLTLTPQDMLTDKGKTLYAEEKFTSPLYRKAFGPLVQLATYYFDFTTILGGWHPNEAEARLLYENEERKKRMQEMDELMNLDALGRKVDAKEFRSQEDHPPKTGMSAVYGPE